MDSEDGSACEPGCLVLESDFLLSGELEFGDSEIMGLDRDSGTWCTVTREGWIMTENVLFVIEEVEELESRCCSSTAASSGETDLHKEFNEQQVNSHKSRALSDLLLQRSSVHQHVRF